MRTAKEDWFAFPARDASRALALTVEFRSMMFRNITLAQTVLTLSDASGTVSLLSCLFCCSCWSCSSSESLAATLWRPPQSRDRGLGFRVLGFRFRFRGFSSYIVGIAHYCKSLRVTDIESPELDFYRFRLLEL